MEGSSMKRNKATATAHYPIGFIRGATTTGDFDLGARDQCACGEWVRRQPVNDWPGHILRTCGLTFDTLYGEVSA
jgi:hypothetical protein